MSDQKRVIVETDEDTRKWLKVIAAHRRVSMKQLIRAMAAEEVKKTLQIAQPAPEAPCGV